MYSYFVSRGQISAKLHCDDVILKEHLKQQTKILTDKLNHVHRIEWFWSQLRKKATQDKNTFHELSQTVKDGYNNSWEHLDLSGIKSAACWYKR